VAEPSLGQATGPAPAGIIVAPSSWACPEHKTQCSRRQGLEQRHRDQDLLATITAARRHPTANGTSPPHVRTELPRFGRGCSSLGRRARPARSVIDLSELGFMGASTVGTIVRARELLRRRSGSLTVRSAPPFVRRSLDICGLNQLLGPSVEEAGNPSGGALGSWVPVPVAELPLGQPGPSGTAPRALPAPVHHVGALRAQAVGAERMTRATVDRKA
jgi:anti-anti-sigma factor